MTSSFPIPPGFILLKLGGLSSFEGGVYLLPRSSFSTVESLNNTLREKYSISSSSIKRIKFTIAGGRNEVSASVQRDHWAEFYDQQAFDCISVEEDLLDRVGYGGGGGEKKYVVKLSMGLWTRGD
jgi:hypothetical protein